MPGYLGAGKRVDQPGAAFGGIFVELEFCVGAALGDQKAVAGARFEEDIFGPEAREMDGKAGLPGDGPYAERGNGVLPGYGGSKAALEHLTQCAAFDLQRHGIAVNALSPSQAIMTPGVAYYAAEFDELGSADLFADAVVRLAQVDANVVTGRTIGHLDVLDGSFRPYS